MKQGSEFLSNYVNARAFQAEAARDEGAPDTEPCLQRQVEAAGGGLSSLAPLGNCAVTDCYYRNRKARGERGSCVEQGQTSFTAPNYKNKF